VEGMEDFIGGGRGGKGEKKGPCKCSHMPSFRLLLLGSLYHANTTNLSEVTKKGEKRQNEKKG